MTAPNGNRDGGTTADAPPTKLTIPTVLVDDVHASAIMLLGHAAEALERACDDDIRAENDWRGAVEQIHDRGMLVCTLSEHASPHLPARDAEVVLTPTEARELVAVLDYERGGVVNNIEDPFPATNIAEERSMLAAIDVLAEQARAAALREPSGQQCAACFAPATYQGPGEVYCSPCAERYSNRESASAYSALRILTAVAQAMPGDVSADDMVAALRDAVDESSYVELSEPKLPRWALGLFDMDTRYRPLTGGDRTEATR